MNELIDDKERQFLDGTIEVLHDAKHKFSVRNQQIQHTQFLRGQLTANLNSGSVV